MSEIASRAPHRGRAPVARVFGPLTRVFNPLALRFAGSRVMPLYAVIRHRGRRSGRVYATPVAVTRRGDALVVPLPFGSSADWCRNVVAAGECIVRWNGAEHRMIAPEILGEEGRREFNGVERWALPRLGIASFLRLRFATAP